MGCQTKEGYTYCVRCQKRFTCEFTDFYVSQYVDLFDTNDLGDYYDLEKFDV